MPIFSCELTHMYKSVFKYCFFNIKSLQKVFAVAILLDLIRSRKVDVVGRWWLSSLHPPSYTVSTNLRLT